MADQMKILKITILFFMIWIFSPFTVQCGFSGERHAMIIDLDGSISSGASTFLTRGINEAEEQGSSIVIIRLDTPGGLSVSMKTMVKTIMNSSIPVVVYVSPKGAGAASAGVLITVAAHIAAMAPGTNIGAAHPVQSDGSDIQKTMETKVVNDMASYGRGIAGDKGRNAEWVEAAIRDSVSITADEAVEKNVVDLIAVDMDELLRLIDNREVTVNSGKIRLETSGLEKIYFEPRSIDKILMFISDPTIMAILFSIGLLGLGFEITHPGAVFPGVIGAISLILAFYSMQFLPVNYAGLLLMALAVVLFLAEIKITSYGLLTLGGIISLTLGSMMFFEDLGLSYTMSIPFIVVISAFFIFVAWLAVRSQMTSLKGGTDGLIGETGIVKEVIDQEGLIFVHGEYWKAVSDDKIDQGEKVKVVDVHGLALKVVKT
ncbi:nodulation protein NfeD [Deltaproteobacteria bacterium]|nr:nodulation protein NfeD [Deltaproteobacteria bacterium]